MTSLVTQMFVAERYGLRLTIAQLSNVLGITEPAIYNQVSKGSFPIATYVESGKRWADYRAVAEHLDACAARAKVEA